MKKKLLFLMLALVGIIGMCEAEDDLYGIGIYRLLSLQGEDGKAFSVSTNNEQYLIRYFADPNKIDDEHQCWFYVTIDGKHSYSTRTVEFTYRPDSIILSPSGKIKYDKDVANIIDYKVGIDNYGEALGHISIMRYNHRLEHASCPKNTWVQEYWEHVRPSKEATIIASYLFYSILGVPGEDTKKLSDEYGQLRSSMWTFNHFLNPTEDKKSIHRGDTRIFGDDYCVRFTETDVEYGQTYKGYITPVKYLSHEERREKYIEDNKVHEAIKITDIIQEDGRICVIKWSPDHGSQEISITPLIVNETLPTEFWKNECSPIQE